MTSHRTERRASTAACLLLIALSTKSRAAAPSIAGPTTPPTAAAKPAPESQSHALGGCPPPGSLFLPTGFTFPALLPNAVYSYNTLAPVIATLEDDVSFQERVVLPRGTRLVGTASTLHTLDRVNINWTLAVLPEGCEFAFSGLSLSADDGSAGIKGVVEKHSGSVAAQVAIQSALGVANAAAQVASPMESALASGFTSQASSSLGQEMTKAQNLESIYIHERTEIRVFVLHRFMRVKESE